MQRFVSVQQVQARSLWQALGLERPSKVINLAFCPLFFVAYLCPEARNVFCPTRSSCLPNFTYQLPRSGEHEG